MSTPKWLVALQLIVLATLAGAVWADFTDRDAIWRTCIAVFAALAPLNVGVRTYRCWQRGQRQMSDAPEMKRAGAGDRE